MEYNNIVDDKADWNMTQGYYEILAELKRFNKAYYRFKDAESYYRSLKAELGHVEHFIAKNTKDLSEIYKYLSSARRLIYSANMVGKMGEDFKNKKNSEALELIWFADKILNSLEGKEGMLLKLQSDPMYERRKYGD